MNGPSDSDSPSLPLYDTARVMDIMNDPIKLSIILELIREPGSTPLEIKKKLVIPGSRIYYYLNQLVDERIIVESATERLTSHLSRRKFKLSDWFIDAFTELDKAFHDKKRGQRKAFHLFQIRFAIMILNQQARLLEKIPAAEFDDFMDTLQLPYQQFFFANEETLPIINDMHRETSVQVFKKHEKYQTMFDLIKNSSHVAIFGAYPLEIDRFDQKKA